MSKVNKNTTDEILNALRGSGFPFQTAVAHVIRSTPGCTVYTSEYPWRGPENEDRFLDIIAINGPFVLTIECKKTEKETLTFLLPIGYHPTGKVEDFRCLSVGDLLFARPHPPVRCETWNMWPPSPSSEFCVIGSSKGGTKRMLEKNASLLVAATDAFALDRKECISLQCTLTKPYQVLPVIVTNAKISTACYAPTEVSLHLGQFDREPSEIEFDIPWVRFSKTFIAGQGRDIGYRNIFVVSSGHFQKFLTNLLYSPQQPPDKNAATLFVRDTWR